MTLEELQDYALNLQNGLDQVNTLVSEKDAKISELQGLNVDLQKRNRDLFLKVEQQTTTPPTSQGEGEPPTPTCEEFAKNNYKEILK